MSPTGSVFVVDDDASVRRAVQRLLQAVGYHVETFASAQAFLERGERGEHERPACVLLDVRMPEMGGFDLFAALKAAGRSIPVIFVTGHGDIPMAVRAIKGGAADFLTKPCDEEVLLEAIAQALAKDTRDRG